MFFICSSTVICVHFGINSFYTLAPSMIHSLEAKNDPANTIGINRMYPNSDRDLKKRHSQEGNL